MIKTPEEVALMAEAGRLLASVFTHLDQLDLCGMSTLQVDGIVDNFIVHNLKARPASKGQYASPTRSTPPSTAWCATGYRVPATYCRTVTW